MFKLCQDSCTDSSHSTDDESIDNNDDVTSDDDSDTTKDTIDTSLLRICDKGDNDNDDVCDNCQCNADSQSDVSTVDVITTSQNDSLISTETHVKELVRKKIVTAHQKESLRQRKKFAKKNITPSGRKNTKKQKAKLNDFWDY